MKRTLFLAFVFILISALSSLGLSTSEGVDWPQWGGQNRNFTSVESGYDPHAFSDGVKVLWEAEVGFGRCSVVISDGWLYTLGVHDRSTSVFCINAKTGKERWVVPVKGKMEAQATPAVDGNSVYAFSPAGVIYCLRANSGKIVWSVDIEKEYEMAKANFGVASSPIVVDDMVIIHGNNVLVALNKLTGEEIWSYREDDQRYANDTYSTPYTMIIDDNMFLIRQGQLRLEAFSIKTGDLVAFTRDFESDYSGPNNVDDGIVEGNRVLMSGPLLPSEIFSFNGNDFVSEWISEDFEVAITPFIFADGYLYGFEWENGLFCVDATNGNTIWREELKTSRLSSAGGYGGLTLVDGVFFSPFEPGNAYRSRLVRCRI